MEWFPTFKGLWPWPWIRSYYIPSCITYRTLPTCQISLKSKKVLWTDGHIRTYGQTGGHLRPTLLGWLRRVDIKTVLDDIGWIYLWVKADEDYFRFQDSVILICFNKTTPIHWGLRCSKMHWKCTVVAVFRDLLWRCNMLWNLLWRNRGWTLLSTTFYALYCFDISRSLL